MTQLMEQIKEKDAQAFTHSGKFHADDVFSSALLLSVNPEITIHRGSQVPEDFKGIVFDIGRGKYDHHQRDSRIRENGVPYAAFGLLWEELGAEILGEELAEKFDEAFVQPLDNNDNTGEKNELATLIGNFNPPWDAQGGNDAAFFKAVGVAGMILDNKLERYRGNERADKRVEEILKQHQEEIASGKKPADEKQILVLPDYVPCQKYLSETDIAFVIFPSNRGGYCIQPQKREYSLNYKCSFPESWLGLEKEELKEIVDFLKSPQKYIEVGARIPKGVILVGPPGTGKTLLAKAVSGEAGVPFFSISGSDFVEMFVGVGASRVRDLFEDAKRNAPCIVFIDEIDAVARRRGTGLGGGHDEREQTLNQLLVMDGFGVNEGIIVMAATNRVDILDPAILRPGRFDRKVAVGRPDVKGREEILKVHVKGKPLAEDVDLHQIARTTPGFSGADLENLMNEAAIHAARNNARFIRMEDIRKSFIKVGIGTEKKSRLVPELERKITAYHEAGHAILFHLLPDVGPVYTVSIIPTGMGAAGYTMPVPENDNVFETKGRMIQEIKVGMGGRIAEELIFDDVTTGASQDIKQVTDTARSMITKFGMSDRLGFINYEENTDEVFLGRDLGHSRSFSEEVASIIDKEVKKLVDDCYTDAKRILTENMDVLHSCANLLLEKERISREEFEALFKNDKAAEENL
mgnify:CR=1 FL=1